MGTLSTSSGITSKGEPFVQIIHNKVALTQVPPAAAVEFALGIISTASEAVVDAAAFRMVTSAGRSVSDAFDLIKSLRAARGELVATTPVPEPAAPALPSEPVQPVLAPLQPQREPYHAAVVALNAEQIQGMRLLARCPLMEDITADDYQVRVPLYDALQAQAICINDEYMLVDRTKNFVRDGRYFITIQQRGFNDTVAAAHKRGAEVISYHVPLPK